MYRMPKIGFLGIGSFILATGTLAAQTTFNLVAVQGASLGGVYTSPYYATVGSSSSEIPVICDDFVDNSFVPETWTAYVTSLSDVTGSTVPAAPASPYGPVLSGAASPPQFAGGWVGNTGLSQEQAYTVVSYLAVEILDQSPGSTAAQDLSFAMWALFDPAVFIDQTNGSVSTPCTLPNGEGCLDATDLSAAETDLSNALTAVNSLHLTTANFDAIEGVDSVTIYTYDPNGGAPSCGGSTCLTSPPQEFIAVTVAEPPSPALLGFDLLAVAGLFLIARRRWAGSLS